MNRIPRNFKSITGTFLHGSCENVRMVITKDEQGYHGRETETGRTWSIFASHLRNSDFFKIEEINL